MRKIIAAVLATIWILMPFALSEGSIDKTELAGRIFLDNLLKTENSVSVVKIYYDSDGQEQFSVFAFAALDQNGKMYYVYEDSEGNVEILSENGCMGFDAWSMQMYVPVFLMDEYEVNIVNLKQSFFCDAMLNEQIVKDEVKENAYLVVTETVTSIAEDEGARVMEYVFESRNGRLTEVREAYRTAEGEKELVSRSYVYYGKEYEVNEAFVEVSTPDNVREIEIITVLEGEMASETFIVPANVTVMFIYPEEYSLYADLELTRMYAGEELDKNGEYPEKTTIYMGELY